MGVGECGEFVCISIVESVGMIVVDLGVKMVLGIVVVVVLTVVESSARSVAVATVVVEVLIVVGVVGVVEFSVVVVVGLRVVHSNWARVAFQLISVRERLRNRWASVGEAFRL